MRSTNIAIFLVLLYSAAAISGVIFPGALDASMTGGQIDAADTALSQSNVSQPSADEVTGSFLNNGNIIQNLQDIIFLGPNMLTAIGMPRIFSGGLTLVFGFVVAFDIAEAITGRVFS